jgi:hypothetical protein
MTGFAFPKDYLRKNCCLAHPCQGCDWHRQECLCYSDLEDVAFAGDDFV